jgi:hypothetical protein
MRCIPLDSFNVLDPTGKGSNITEIFSELVCPNVFLSTRRQAVNMHDSPLGFESLKSDSIPLFC